MTGAKKYITESFVSSCMRELRRAALRRCHAFQSAREKDALDDQNRSPIIDNPMHAVNGVRVRADEVSGERLVCACKHQIRLGFR
jgi:hypothetical protein